MAARPREPEDEAAKVPPEPAATNGNGVGDGAVDIPEPDAKKTVSKYARFKATEQVKAATEEASHTCAYGPPPRTAFARAHPDKSLRIGLLTVVHEVGTKKTSYLLDDSLQTDPELEGMVKLVMLVPWVTHHQPHKLGIWPISIENERNPWIQSALTIVDAITLKWLRVIPVVKRSEYVTKPDVVGYRSRTGPNSQLISTGGWTGLSGRVTGSPRRTGLTTIRYARPSGRGADSNVGQAAVRPGVGRGLRVSPAERRLARPFVSQCMGSNFKHPRRAMARPRSSPLPPRYRSAHPLCRARLFR
jgi:hypothetical protein